MRVLLVVPSLRKTGVTQVLKSLILENVRNNDNIEYFLIALRRVDNCQQVNSIKEILKERLVVLNSKHIFSISSIISLKKEILKIKPDIIHFNGFNSEIYRLFLNSKKLIYISTSHNLGKEDFQYSYGKIIGFIMSVIQLYIYKKMDCIVAVSESVKNCYVKKTKRRIEVIKNGVNGKATYLQKNKKIENYTLTGIYVGNLDKRKNIVFLLEAFKRRKDNVKLLVLGDNPQDEHYLSELKGKYASEKIEFEGRKANVFPFLKKANFFISASLSEGLPMAALEAMSMNLDLILSNIPQHEELKVEENQDVFFFEPSEKSIDKTLDNYINNYDGNHISNNIFCYKRLFTSKKMYKNYAKLYQNLVNSRRESDK